MIYNSTISFCAKPNNPNSSVTFPIKRELTDTEKEFNEVLLKYNTTTQNIKCQKELLRSYYSSQDKYDYQMLLKEKNSLARQLKRIAKNAGTDAITMEMDIIGKKDYNRFAPKIFRAKTLAQLDEIQKLISDTFIFANIKTFLLKIISEQKNILKNNI